jgi:hypothetical protein
LTTLDMGQNALQVNGTFTLTAVNERITAGRYISVGAGGLFHVQGQNTSLANTPTMQVGVESRFTIGATDFLGAFCWDSTVVNNPGIIRITDASVRIGVASSSQVINCGPGRFGRLQTRGSYAGLFRTTSADNRMRVTSSGVCDFQADKTVLQFWLNIGTPQPSLRGLVPYAVDGPEVNMAEQTTAQLIQFDSYDYSAVSASTYPGSKFTLFAGPWVRHKNLSGGTIMAVRWQSSSITSTGAMEFSRVCTITSLTPVGAAIPTAKIFTALAAGPTNAQPKGFASPISYAAETLSASANASGVATFEPVYAIARSTINPNSGETVQASTRSVFRCSGVTPGAETNQVVALAYGYEKQFFTAPMQGSGGYTNTVALGFLSTTDKLGASAAAITGVAVDLTAKTIAVSVSRTVQTVFDRLQYTLVQDANAFIADTSSYVADVLDVADFAFTVSSGTLSAGTIQTTGAITVSSPAVVSADLTGPVNNSGTISGAITGNVTNTGTINGATINGNVSQATPTDLSNVSITGNLTFNTNTPVTVTFTNSTVSGTVSNSGTGLVTITLASGSTIGTVGSNVVTQRFANVTAPNIIVGARVQLYDTTNNVELFNGVLASALNYQYTFVGNITVRLRATYQSGLTAKLPIEATGLLTATGLSFLNSQTDDGVYIGNLINGSTVTEYTPDYPNLQVDVAGGSSTTVQRLYNWSTYIETTADGIRYLFAAISAIDAVNYLIDQAILDVKLDNTGATPVVISGGVITRKDGTTVIAATSGSIQIDPAKAYVANSAEISIDLQTIKNYTAASV